MMKAKYQAGFFLLFICLCGTSAAERLCISAPIANIRSGPGTEGYDVLWKAEKYYPLEIIEKDGEWLYFKDFEGDKGWINNSLVGNMPTVVTVRDKCNLRSGPGTGPTETVIFTLEKGVPFMVLEKKGDWLHVQHADGEEGWLHKDLVW